MCEISSSHLFCKISSSSSFPFKLPTPIPLLSRDVVETKLVVEQEKQVHPKKEKEKTKELVQSSGPKLRFPWVSPLFYHPPHRFTDARSNRRCRQPLIPAKDGAFLRFSGGFLVVSWHKGGALERFLPSPAKFAAVALCSFGARSSVRRYIWPGWERFLMSS